MTKKIWVCAAAMQTAVQLCAGGMIAPLEAPPAAEEIPVKKNYYVIVKGLMITGDEVEHGAASLDGDRGYGFGIDIGYRFAEGFAIEYDFSYAENSVEETDGATVEEGDAKYYTSALDLAYTYEVAENIGVFGKFGYEFEHEKIDTLDIDGDDSGLVYGVGIEISIDETYKAVLEYEHSIIEGPHGNSVFAGVMYNF